MQDFFNKIIKKIKLGYKITTELLKTKQYITIYDNSITICNDIFKIAIVISAKKRAETTSPNVKYAPSEGYLRHIARIRETYSETASHPKKTNDPIYISNRSDMPLSNLLQKPTADPARENHRDFSKRVSEGPLPPNNESRNLQMLPRMTIFGTTMTGRMR